MHLRRKPLAIVLLGVGAVATITTVWAQAGGAYDASFNAFSGGGQTAGGGSYTLQVAAGQPMAGTARGGSYSLEVGVLAGGTGAAAPGGTPTVTPSASPSPTTTPAPGAIKRYLPQVAKDGVY